MQEEEEKAEIEHKPQDPKLLAQKLKYEKILADLEKTEKSEVNFFKLLFSNKILLILT